MRWKEGTFEKIATSDSAIEKLIHTFKEQNVNGGAVISCFKVHNENFFKEIPHLKDGYDHFFRRIFNSLDIMHNLEELKYIRQKNISFNFNIEAQ